MQSFLGSLVPAARMAALFGTQYQKAAFRVVPPSCDAFSRTRTLLPCQQLNNAVAKPATPLPIAMISGSASNLPLAAAGAEDFRAIVAKQCPPSSFSGSFGILDDPMIEQNKFIAFALF